MTPLEAFAILVLVAAVVVLLYYYLQDNRKLNLGRMKSDATTLGERVYGEANSFGEKVQGGAGNLGEKVSGEGSMSGMGEKYVSGVSEKVSGMSEKIKGKVNVPISTDNLSHRIDLFLNEQSDQLIEDWDLATKKDLSALEKRFNVVSTDIESLEKRFKDYSGTTNKKLEDIEARLEKLENPEDEIQEEKPKQ
jgi:cell shape-determining protein MreC